MKTKAFFTQDDTARVKAAIDLAYARSGCDITIVISDDSGRYDRAEDVFGVCLSALILTLCWFGLPLLQNANSNSWEIQNAAILSLPVILLIIFGGFALGAFLATIFPPLKTLFVARQEMAEEVAKAAESFFYTQGLRYAKHGAGILIYVSRFEHMVQLIGDDATSPYLTDEDWQAAQNAIISGIKRRQAADGFVDAITLLAQKQDGAFLHKS